VVPVHESLKALSVDAVHVMAKTQAEAETERLDTDVNIAVEQTADTAVRLLHNPESGAVGFSHECAPQASSGR
jgi:hypothetical protein